MLKKIEQRLKLMEFKKIKSHLCDKHNLILPLVCFMLLLFSCSSKKNYPKTEILREFVFQNILFNNKKTCEIEKPEKFYYPSALNKFFLRHQITENGILYYFEVYNPQFAGRFESADFYTGYEDNGNWLETLFPEGDGLLSEDYLVDQPFDFNSTKAGIELVYSDSTTKRWRDSNNRLTSTKFENEIFVPVKKDNNYILINSSKKITTRTFYDENFLIQKKEYWKISNVYDSSVIQKEEFFYNESTKKIEKKILTKQDSNVITYYNENQLPGRVDVYLMDGESKYLQSRTLWRYTDDGKINIEESTEFFYENNDYSKFSDKLTRRQSYTYRKNEKKSKNDEEELPPDYKYYENGKLKMKTEYESKGNYVSTVIFDEKYSVQSFYEDDIRKKDVYLVDGIVQRVKDYE